MHSLLGTEAEVLVMSGVPQMTAELVQQAFGILFKGSPYKLEIDRFVFEDSSVYVIFTDPAGGELLYVVHIHVYQKIALEKGC